MRERYSVFSGRDAVLIVMAIALTLIGTVAAANGNPVSDNPISTLNELARLTDDLRLATPSLSTPAELRRLEDIARARRSLLADMLRTDPDAALANALSYADYADLPATVQPLVERPFSQTADLSVIACDGIDTCILTGTNGIPLTATRAQERAGLTSKRNLPVQGVELDGRVAIHGQALQLLNAADAAAAATFFGYPVANPDPERDFFTGKLLPPTPIVALAGGRRFLFATEESVTRLNAELARMDALPGPDAGSQVLFSPNLATTRTGFDLAAAWTQARQAQSAWTETPMTYFVIRCDFTDRPGEPISKAGIELLFNSPISNQMSVMSYRKTCTVATASVAVVRMPQTAAYYAAGDIYELTTDAIDGFNALGTGITLTDYDVVCLAYASIGVSYAGLAIVGGNRMWLPGYFTERVITHESGHNYGLLHAKFWETSDGSIAGPGTEIDYGDTYDIMGNGSLTNAHFNLYGKQRLNWLTATQWTNVTVSGNYRISRLDDPDTDPAACRGLRIARTSGGGYYWVGFRLAYASNAWACNGANLLWQPSGASYTCLLDFHPDTARNLDDAMLPIGRTYSDSSNNVHITPLTRGGTGSNEWIDVHVQIGVPTNEAPIVTFSASATSAVARTDVVRFSSAASDADGDLLVHGWEAPNPTNLARWPAGQVPILTTDPQWAARWMCSGTYTVRVCVTDCRGGLGATSFTVRVTDPLDTWQERTSGVSNRLSDIAAGRGPDGVPLLVAVGDKTTLGSNIGAAVCRSTNGTDWSAVVTPSINDYLYGVTYDGSSFIACGMDYRWETINGWVGLVRLSADGSNWATRTYLGATAGAELYSVAAGGGRVVAVGRNGTIIYSTDGGTNWSAGTSGTTQLLRGVTYSNGIFIAVGGPDASSAYQILTSTDGAGWTNRTSGTVFPLGNLKRVAWLHDAFFTSGWASGLLRSDNNGTNFSNVSGGREELRALAYGNGTFFAAGIDPYSSNQDVDFVSFDGRSWQKLLPGSISNRNAAVFFNNTFITVGESGSIRQSAVVTAPGGWAAFQANYWPNGGASSMTDDPDGDNAPNGIEYALGTTPTNANSWRSFQLEKRDGHSVAVIPYPADAGDMTYTVAISRDLQNWQELGVMLVAASTNEIVLRAPDAYDADTCLFYRLRASGW